MLVHYLEADRHGSRAGANTRRLLVQPDGGAVPPGVMQAARGGGQRGPAKHAAPDSANCATRDSSAANTGSAGRTVAGSDGVFHADLHIHSRFSRACSKDCDLPKLAWWAARKGITAVGTGDFTHPAWAAELAESLVPAEPGLLRLRGDLASASLRALPPSCRAEPRFMLSAEISTIYSRDSVTRKVHHLIYAPTFEAAGKITAALAKTGNLASDGRPILGLDSRHLLEITLSAGPGCFLVPAHIWTPWFAVLGSKSGFDTVAECYLDLAGEVFAVETGLSSDPPMNWIFSALDRYRLVSNSDAHSPPMLGREATTFSAELSYFAIATALRTGDGLAGTLNFFPEGGRYHLDGHRKCGVRLSPAQSVSHGGMCPECGKPLTIGVLHRVTELADRPEGTRPPGTANYSNLVSLPEIVGEIKHAGPKSKKVAAEVDRLTAALGPELHILCDADAASIQRAGGSVLAEAVTRLRRGQVLKEPGYDGEYGVIRLFQPAELDQAGALFDIPAPARPPAGETTQGTALRAAGPRGAPLASRSPQGTPALDTDQPAVKHPPPAIVWATSGELLAGLDPDQRAAAEAAGPLMIIAGPGTGKTATLTHRIAADVTERGLPPQACLALTFTRRAAEEMQQRLARLLPAHASKLTVTTFHGLGLAILREHAALAGLTSEFTVAGDAELLAVAAEHTGSQRAARRLLAQAAAEPARRAELTRLLTAGDMVGFDGLVELPVALMNNEPHVAAALRDRWRSISVDEYQDIDASQYALLRLLAGDGSGLTVIGDPDQAIYGFRGADVGFFLRFGRDYPGASTIQLTRNYRSSPAIVTSALQAVAPATLVPGRVLRPATGERGPGGTGSEEIPPKITVHEAADENAEAAWIAAAIDRLLGGASFHSLDSGRAEGHAGGRLDLADVAVLYRTDAQAGVLGQGLAHAGLPFQKRSHDLLLRRPAVPEIIHELRLAADRPDAPPTAVADAPPTAVADAPPTAVADGPPTAVADGPRTAVTERLARVVRELAARPRDDGAAAVDVLTAGEVLAPLARLCGQDLERFLTEIALGAETDALDPRADAISLLTMHAAKGMEFKVVFLAGCERGLLPLWYGARSADSAEERRLLFVGMTRARAHLFLTCAARRRRHGTDMPAGLSPFISSIRPDLIDRSAAVLPRRPAQRQLKLL
jgi:ATP-dependent DNA helicase UvrD/PcrA